MRAIIVAAIEGGDPNEVAVAIKLARATNPADIAEIEALEAEFAASLAQAEADKAREDERALRDAGLFENWRGQGQLGFFRSSGNSDNAGITAGLELERVGIDWRHKLTGLVDYQETAGLTTREQFLAAYEPNYQLSESLFAFGLAQYERDRFQGFSSRIAASGGLGYRVIQTDNAELSVKAGPAWRRTSFIGGGTDNALAGLAALDFDWRLSSTLKLTQDASAFVQSGNSTLVSMTGLEAGLGSGLSARISYAVEHDTNPPAGAVKTDTITRATLIYGF